MNSLHRDMSLFLHQFILVLDTLLYRSQFQHFIYFFLKWKCVSSYIRLESLWSSCNVDRQSDLQRSYELKLRVNFIEWTVTPKEQDVYSQWCMMWTEVQITCYNAPGLLVRNLCFNKKFKSQSALRTPKTVQVVEFLETCLYNVQFFDSVQYTCIIINY